MDVALSNNPVFICQIRAAVDTEKLSDEIHFKTTLTMSKQLQTSATLLRYCVGIDVSKDTLQICVSVIDSQGKVTIKGTCKVNNKVTGFDSLLSWVKKHCKEQNLPMRFVMETTGTHSQGSITNNLPGIYFKMT